ncbi:RagB/SusD family nutrient uptake outer membrane protein [Pontibacter actiniarum]|uniref:RagB/SusD family nutrient uptake outer membrane protein n=1 Tax=Pontibacter actiniarum TaxID=323450 RepID=A0A1X9YT43_9BACT|nr:RagB/SusD family nutrient uptake outer membrane protein [Pontibacter actiniarum]ARS36028.1 RagB/SusD family nutrient uptake outer membrane protein [Pontibacter actiniarum]
MNLHITRFLIGLGLGLSLVLATSCDDIIDVEPVYEKEKVTVFKNLNEFEYALTGAYALFRQTGYYGNGSATTGAFSVLPDMMGTNLVETNEELGNYITQTDWVYVADDSDIALTWQAAYYIINQANQVLSNNIEQFKTADEKRVNLLRGQALAIRGLVHFDLLRYWGVSYERNSTALGIPYKTTTNQEEMPSRLSVKESYDKILADLKEAEILLGDVDKAINIGSNKSYIDQLAVKAMLARVSLYARNYEEAEAYATAVIHAYPLASKADFPEIWKDASASEVIWSVAYSAGQGSPSNSLYYAANNRNGYRPSATLEAMYDKANDIRFDAYFGSAERAGTERRIVNKHMGRGTAKDNLVNWKVFRTGEMYLIRAEARAMQAGRESLGLEDLNTLRTARINNYAPVALSGQDLIDAIAVERQKELFAEGHQWFDLKRTTRIISRTDCGSASQCTLEPDSRAWAWPVPQGEIIANMNIRSQQTPGYN